MLLNGVFLVAFCPVFAFNADSIKASIQLAEKDTALLSKYAQLGYHFKSSNPDTAKYFFRQLISTAQSLEQNDDINHRVAEAYIQLAAVNQYQGDSDDALSNNAIADSIVHQYNFKDFYAVVENTKGLVFYNKGDYEKALQKYQEALNLSEDIGDTLFMAKVYANMAIIHFYQGNYDDATLLFKQPVVLARQLSNDDLLAGNLMNVGLVYYYLGNLDSSTHYYHQSIEIYEKIDGDDGLLLCYKNLACVYYTHCQYDLALETYYNSLELAIQLGDKTTMSKDYQNIGEVYMRLGDMERALDYSLKAVRIKEQLGDKPTIATSYNSIGALHKARGNYSEAITYHQQALDIFRALDHQQGISKSLSSIAGVYADTDSLASALRLYKEAVQIDEKIGDNASLAADLLSLGRLYIKVGELTLARQNINKAIALNSKLGDEESIAYAYLSLSQIASQNGVQKQALSYAHKSLAIAERIGSLPLKYDVTSNLASVYKAVADYPKALEYAEYHQLLSDSIYSAEKNEAMINAEMLWQVERKETEILNLKNKDALSQQILARRKAEIKRQQAILIGAALLLGMFVIIILIMRISSRRKHDLMLEKQRSSVIKLKMENIQNRISPHFFFNALSAATLPLNDFPEHRAMYDDLVLLLKRSLESAEKIAVTIGAELEIVNTFVALQQKKLNGSFDYVSDIELSDMYQTVIPAMIIQIPIENAIKHGLAEKEGKRLLKLDCWEDAEMIRICIEDNGVGRKKSGKKTTGTGTGLKVLMQTIELLNANNTNKIVFNIIDLESDKGNDSGTLVEIRIPKIFTYQL